MYHYIEVLIFMETLLPVRMLLPGPGVVRATGWETYLFLGG